MRPSPHAVLIRRKVTGSKWSRRGVEGIPKPSVPRGYISEAGKEPNSDSRSYLDPFRGQRSLGSRHRPDQENAPTLGTSSSPFSQLKDLIGKMESVTKAAP